MRAEFPERFFNRLTPTTTDKQDQMIFSMQNFEIHRLSAATPVDITSQLAMLYMK
jgi:hypothetical protein